MKSITRIQRGLYLTGKGLKLFFAHPFLLIFPLLSSICLLLLEGLVIKFLYYRYGIQIFDDSTLEAWAFISLWELSVISILIIGPLYFLVHVITLLTKLAVSHAQLAIYQQENHIIATTITRSVHCVKEIIKYAWLSTILLITEESALKKYLRSKARDLGGDKFVLPHDPPNWFETNFLVIPLIAFHNLPLAQALKKSENLMKEQFGSYFSATFSFSLVSGGLALLCAIFSGILHITFFNPLMALSLFFALAAIIYTLVNAVESIFQTSTYHYCKQQQTVPYTREDVEQSFENYEENHTATSN